MLVLQKHLKIEYFFGGMSQSPQLLVFTAPNSDSNFTAAGGAGSVNVGFDITAIKDLEITLYIW